MTRAAILNYHLAAVLLCAGCGGDIQRERIRYRYRQSVVGQETNDPLLAGGRGAPTSSGRSLAEAAPAPMGGSTAASRCKRRRGWRYRGDLAHATHTLISACLGRDISAGALKGEGLSLRQGRPRVGDLVLFHNTLDQNKNGALDDRFTRAGLVVDMEGTKISFIHIRSNRARLGKLNLGQPNRRRLKERGAIQNSYLRTVRPGDPPDTPYLAGQLLAGFASP